MKQPASLQPPSKAIEATQSPASLPRSYGPWLALALIALACAAVYSNSFKGPFVFDDIPSIQENASIRQLWPLSVPLNPPNDAGLTVSGRPLLNLSLALNYALSGREPWSYHATNLLIHILAAFALFGVVRRTLLLPSLSPRYGELALPCALAASLLWALHPLQTEAVTFVVQRAESLMGLFFLLSLYCFVRSLEAERPRIWQMGTFLGCLLGAACKEVIATAPVLLLLFDRCFAAGSFREAWRRRGNFFACLFLTWVPLALLVLGTGGNRGGTFKLTPSAFWNYGLTQFEAVARYLQLSLWPSPLVFEYGVFRVNSLWPLLGFALPVLALLGLTLWALWRRPMAAYPGAWFFVILAPTSIMPGVMQVIVEHRMYLPLAALTVLASLAAARLGGRRGLLLLVLPALVFGGLTYSRNHDYRSHQALWEDTVAKRPESAPAQANLATAYDALGREQEARWHYEESLRLNPDSPLVHYNLGVVLLRQGHIEQSRQHFAEAVRLQPRLANAQCMLAATLLKQGRLKEALGPVELALGYRPTYPEAHHTLGLIRMARGQLPEALESFREALRHQPDFAEAEINLCIVLIRMGQMETLEEHFKRALQLSPDPASVHFNIGIALGTAGRTVEAAGQYVRTLELKPRHAEAHLNLGILLGQQGRMAEALEHLQTAEKLQPESPEAQLNLGIALAMSDQTEAAIARYEAALRLRPEYAIAHYNLGNALLRLERFSEAKRHFAEALRLKPDFEAARQLLEALP